MGESHPSSLSVGVQKRIDLTATATITFDEEDVQSSFKHSTVENDIKGKAI